MGSQTQEVRALVKLLLLASESPSKRKSTCAMYTRVGCEHSQILRAWL